MNYQPPCTGFTAFATFAPPAAQTVSLSGRYGGSRVRVATDTFAKLGPAKVVKRAKVVSLWTWQVWPPPSPPLPPLLGPSLETVGAASGQVDGVCPAAMYLGGLQGHGD